MSTERILIGAAVPFTITLNALGANAARQSNAVVLPTGASALVDVGIYVQISITAGAPTGSIATYIAGSLDGVHYDFPATNGGDALVTIATASLNARLAQGTKVNAQGAAIACVTPGIAFLFGGNIPNAIVLIVQNLTGQAFDGANCSASYYPINYVNT